MSVDFDLLSPGDTVGISDEDTSPVAPDEVWHANIHRYELYLALLNSGDEVIYSPYSVRHPVTGLSVSDRSFIARMAGEAESDKVAADGYRDAFARRRDVGFHFDISAQICHTYVDTLSRQAIDRSAISGVPAFAPILADVDLRGTPIEPWIAWEYYLGLGCGWHATLVVSGLGEGGQPSRLHELAAGERPYARTYLPHRVYQLDLDRRGRVARALFHDADDLWTEWDAVGWREMNEAGDILREGTHGFDRCPVELFTANPPVGEDPKAPPGFSAIKAIALVDVAILNHLSLGDDTHRKTAYPWYHLQADVTDERLMGDLALGAGSMLVHEAPGDWKAPPEHCARVNWEHISRLEGMAYKMGGVHRRSQESVEAHSGLALDWENAPIHATVARWALQLRAWELRLWGLFAQALGVDPGPLDVVYPDDFSSRPVDQLLSYAERITQVYSGSPPPWVAVGRDALIRTVVERIAGHQPDVRAALPKTLEMEEPPPPPQPTIPQPEVPSV